MARTRWQEASETAGYSVDFCHVLGEEACTFPPIRTLPKQAPKQAELCNQDSGGICYSTHTSFPYRS